MRYTAIAGGALSLLLCACGAGDAAAPASGPVPAPAPAPTPPGASPGTATLRWSMPTQNTDGSALTNLTGFRVYHGRSATSLVPVTTINSPTATATVVGNLESGTHYFAVSAIAASGAESEKSAVGSKSVP